MGAGHNWQSVFCRYGGYTYYDFSISADGYYAISIGDYATYELYPLAGPTYSNYIRQGYATNLVRVECIGDNLKLLVNGQLLVHIMDPTLTGGEIGLAVASMEGVFSEVSFDNLVVYRP